MAIRVLHVVTYMGRGGLETMIMNYYRHIDRTKVQFDFLVHRDFEADYDKEVRELGGKIYRLPNLNPFSKTYIDKLDDFFAEHREYKIVHSHLDCMAGIPLKYAKKNNVPIRIAHAHSSSQTKDKKYLLKLLYKRNIPKYATHLFACAEDAGRWMFGGPEFTVLNNAIDSKDYIQNNDVRQRVREELAIPPNTFVVGHVGRFAPPKNHRFILQIFSKVLEKNKNSILLLVGDGELRKETEKQAAELGIAEKVMFTGLRSDVPKVLQAMDVFLFPSIYEGLPVSIVEAQAAGLPCLISDKVPIECKKTDLVFQYHLSDGAEKWADYVEKVSTIKKRDTSKEIKTAGFDICENAKWLEKFYCTKYDEIAGRKF